MKAVDTLIILNRLVEAIEAIIPVYSANRQSSIESIKANDRTVKH